jgi:mannose-6-phosphate isomerase-like protein (cupin superfamily)
MIKPRRIVTGNNVRGESEIKINNLIEPNIINGDNIFLELWNTDGNLINNKDSIDRTEGPVILSPPENGSKIRYFSIAPQDSSISADELEQMFAIGFKAIGAEHERINTHKHPGMHVTKSIDYIILISGNATLILDNEEVDLTAGDIVIQRGTNHAWSATGDTPALFIAVLIDSEFK